MIIDIKTLIIGIVGSIAGSLILSYFSKLVKRKKLINEANKKMLKHLENFAVFVGFPNMIIIRSMINSIIREYELKPFEVYDEIQICEEMIKIISESNLSKIKKQELIREFSLYIDCTIQKSA